MWEISKLIEKYFEFKMTAESCIDTVTIALSSYVHSLNKKNIIILSK